MYSAFREVCQRHGRNNNWKPWVPFSPNVLLHVYTNYLLVKYHSSNLLNLLFQASLNSWNHRYKFNVTKNTTQKGEKNRRYSQVRKVCTRLTSDNPISGLLKDHHPISPALLTQAGNTSSESWKEPSRFTAYPSFSNRGCFLPRCCSQSVINLKSKVSLSVIEFSHADIWSAIFL